MLALFNNEAIQFLVLILCSLSGFVAGTIIHHLTKEEQKSGKPYFILIIIGCTSVSLFLAVNEWTTLFWIALVCSIIFLAVLILISESILLPLSFLILGTGLGMAIGNPSILILQSFVSFLAALPASSLLLEQKNNIRQWFLTVALFLIPALVLFIIPVVFS